ncbi:hypothetical protein D3C83_307030 [compost metagenome]
MSAPIAAVAANSVWRTFQSGAPGSTSAPAITAPVTALVAGELTKALPATAMLVLITTPAGFSNSRS